jgi:hypothetical protein
MIVAVVGLIGVIVGAAMNGVVQWLGTRRADRLKARTAARVTRYELRSYHELLAYMISSKHWEPAHWLSPVRWREHQTILAEVCRPDEWQNIERAYLGLEIVDSWHRPQDGVRKPRGIEPDPEKSGMPTILTNVDIAMKALDRLAVVPGDGTAAP